MTDRREMPLTRRGYQPFEVVSALQKAIRRSDPDAAMYWAAEMCGSGYVDWAWRRLRIIAAEDVGPVPGLPSDLYALWSWYVENKRADGKKFNPEGGLFFMAQAIILLCQAPKTRIVDWSFMFHLSDHVERREIPDEALDVHTQEGRRRGRDWVHFLEESGQVIDPDEAARSRGFDSMADELEALSARYREAFEKRHTGRKRELPDNPWKPQQAAPATPGVKTLFEEAP